MRFAFLASVMALIVACSPSQEPPPTLESWCATQPADRCVEAMLILHDAPEQETCLVTSRSDLPLWDQCGVVPNPNPVTTIPPPGIDPAEAELRHFIEVELPLLEARILSLLSVANPPTPVTVNVVFDEPIDLPTLEDFIGELGGTWVAAWRTDFICLPDFAGQSGPDRFAYRDGVERAAAARKAADESPTPVTGRFILEAMWDRMEQAAIALREPGVMIEAMQAVIPVPALSSLDDHPLVSQLRIAVTPDVAGDLSQPPPLECRDA
jgi:hypothetical protein